MILCSFLLTMSCGDVSPIEVIKANELTSNALPIVFIEPSDTVILEVPELPQTDEEEPVEESVEDQSPVVVEEEPIEEPVEEVVIEESAPTTVYRITAYCACEKCCGKTDGITATGTIATEGRTIAVDPNVIPYGTEVIINGHTYIAEDCGGAINGNSIDMYFDSHEAALQWGVRYLEVVVCLN